jgi:CHAT domain-containing protein
MPPEPSYFAIVGLDQGDGIVKIIDLGPAEKIDKAANAVLDAVSRPTSPETSYLKAGEDLYTLVFSKVEACFKSSTVNVVYLSPDAALLTIPFDVLHDGQRFLADRFRFEYVDSPVDAFWRLARTRKLSRRLVAMADPDVSTPNTGQFSVARSFHYTRLREGQNEAKDITSLWPYDKSAPILNKDATKFRLIKESSETGVLHLALHGRFATAPVGGGKENKGEASEIEAINPVDIELSRSVLILAPSSDPPDSGLLSAIQVAGLTLDRTQLVVLAACDSARGALLRGQGTMSLRRAFLAAGARSVMGALWEVDDASTREFMMDFYRSLLQGQSPSYALRDAMTLQRLEHPHPYYWAPFVVSGNGERIS